MMNYKKWLAVVASAVVACSLSGCGVSSKTSGDALAGSDVDVSSYFTERDQNSAYSETDAISVSLADNASTCTSSYVQIDGNVVTVRNAGTFVFSGSLSNGSIVVDANKTDKIQLIFKGVSITSSTSAGLYVKTCDKLFLTLDEATENNVSNGGSFVKIDDNNIDSAIFSKEDFTINGSGKLTVNSPCGHGIVSKDDLTVCGGNIVVNCLNHAICGKDCVKINGGTFNLTSGKDGIHSENADDTTLGYVLITDGNFTIISTGDGISASLTTRIDGGEFNIKSVGKGVKASGELVINGGNVVCDSTDDAFHSNSNVSISSGTHTLSSGDDGIHSDATLSISGGTINVLKSYEGLEGLTISISGGNTSVVASDDGVNAAGGNDSSGFGGFNPNQERFQTSSATGKIEITGGVLKVDAKGDGVDANGSITMSGGECYVSGPTDNGNGALDYDSTATITGGIFIATGSSGMAQNFGSASTQGSILKTVTSASANTKVVLSNASGDELVSFTPSKAFNCIVVSCPGLVVGGTYKLSVGSTVNQISLTSLIYGSTQGGGFGGFGR